MTTALIILLSVAVPVGIYAYWEHRHRQIERARQPERERDLLGRVPALGRGGPTVTGCTEQAGNTTLEGR